jgi:hypothetical protein
MNEYYEYWAKMRDRPYCYPERMEGCKDYAFAIPTRQALKRIAFHSKNIVEIGAGTGYWAKLLTERGVIVHAYDTKAGGTSFYGQKVGKYYYVQSGEEDRILDHPDSDLMLIWPPYDARMAEVCLDHWEAGGGKYLFYVGEGDGGCTGTDAFHERLAYLDLVERLALPQWDGIHDALYIYRRKE